MPDKAGATSREVEAPDTTGPAKEKVFSDLEQQDFDGGSPTDSLLIVLFILGAIRTLSGLVCLVFD